MQRDGERIVTTGRPCSSSRLEAYGDCVISPCWWSSIPLISTRLGVGDSKGARHIATYQLVGLDAVRKKVASACAWPPSSAQASAEKR
jgi:hypothetical protein